MLRNRRRWVVTSLVLVISAVAYVDRVNLSVAAPVLTKEFHTNAAVMGVLLSAFSWTYTLLNIPAGMLVDRVRTRFVYAGAMVLWGVASFLTVLTNSIGAMFGPRLLLGVSESPFIPAAVRTISDWLPKSERGAGGSTFVSGVALGSAVGPPVLGWLVSGWGWRSAFIATGVLSFVVAAGWFAWYRHPSESSKLSDEERELIMAGQEPARTDGQARAPWSTLIRSRDIWAIAGGYFCLLYIQYTFVSWLPSYLVQDRHMTVLKSGFATSIPWACAFLVAIAFGRTSDVLMRRGWSSLSARKVVLVGGMTAALAILGTAFSTSAAAAIFFLSISTSGIVLANGGAWAVTGDITRRMNLPGSASGFINGVANIGGILGPIVTGALVYSTKSFVAPLVGAAAIALVGGLIWLIGIRARPEEVAGAGAAGVVGTGAAETGRHGSVGGVLPVPGPGTGADAPRGNRKLVLAGVAAAALLAVAGLAIYPAFRAHEPVPLAERGASQGVPQTPVGGVSEMEQPPPAAVPGAQAAGSAPAPEAGSDPAGAPNVDPNQVPGGGAVPNQAPGSGQVPGGGAVPNHAPGSGQVPGGGAVSNHAPGSGQEPNQVRGEAPDSSGPGFGPAPNSGTSGSSGSSGASGSNGPRINAAPGASPGGTARGNIHPLQPADGARSGTGAQAAFSPASGGGGGANGSDDHHGDGDHKSGGSHHSGDGRGGSTHSGGGHGDGSGAGSDDGTYEDADTDEGILGGALDIAPPQGLVSGLLGQ